MGTPASRTRIPGLCLSGRPARLGSVAESGAKGDRYRGAMGSRERELVCSAASASGLSMILMFLLLVAGPRWRRALCRSPRVLGRRSSLRQQRTEPARLRREDAAAGLRENFGITVVHLTLAGVSLCGIPQALFGTTVSFAIHAHNVRLQLDATLAASYAEWVAEDLLRPQPGRRKGAGRSAHRNVPPHRCRREASRRATREKRRDCHGANVPDLWRDGQAASVQDASADSERVFRRSDEAAGDIWRVHEAHSIAMCEHSITRGGALGGEVASIQEPRGRNSECMR